MMGPFRRTRQGIEVRLDRADVAILSQIPAMLGGVGAEPGDPAAGRLTVPVYLDDPGSDAEYWRLMRSELDESRSADRSAFGELVAGAEDGVTASPAEAEAFLRVLVEARLVLAARLRVDVAADYERLDEGDHAILDYLASLQALLIRALS
ncbi:MAG: DUF2017 family protein [Acidimicrobiia bacterium]|jgi:hypothetical protein